MTKPNLRKRYYLVIIFVLGSIVLALTMLGTSSTSTRADERRDGPVVITPDNVAFGRTYGEWSAAWEQWADSIPVAVHPLFDNGDCSVGQAGSVWFLGGKFCANGAPNCGTSNVVRTCNVPAGRALYFPVVNSEDSALEEHDDKKQIADLRIFVGSQVDLATSLSCEVDGAPIQQLMERFRVQSPAFGFTIPDDNFFTALGEGNFTGGAYFPGVDDGVYVMLAPLPRGHHLLHFHAAIPTYNFTLDITYHLAVGR